jgi:hypothetical protein
MHKLTRAMWKVTPHLNKSDLTRTGCREGRASHVKIRTALSDTHKVRKKRSYGSYAHKVPRRVRERCQNSHRAAPATQNHHHVPTENDEIFTKRNFKFQPSQTVPQVHQIVRVKQKCDENVIQNSPFMLAQACQHSSNAQKMPRLPCGSKIVRCPAPITQNSVLDFEMSRKY